MLWQQPDAHAGLWRLGQQVFSQLLQTGGLLSTVPVMLLHGCFASESLQPFVTTATGQLRYPGLLHVFWPAAPSAALHLLLHEGLNMNQ